MKRVTPPSARLIAPSTALAFVSLILMLSGCAADSGARQSSPTPTTSASTDVGSGASETPGSPSPSPGTAPSGATGAPLPAGGSPTASAGGCPANDVSIPPGADTATIPDVDGDGRDDTEFYTEVEAPFGYGIHTASGATVILRDDLAGPNRHSGWSVRLENQQVITVIDDGRTATLHAFVDCRFVTPLGANGKPYEFLLNGFGEYGTGVACSTGNGGRQLLGVLAKRNDADRFDITATVVTVSMDGRRATNGSSSQLATDLAESDPRVREAMTSHCGEIPTVATSGR